MGGVRPVLPHPRADDARDDAAGAGAPARWEANGGECEDLPSRAALAAELERCRTSRHSSRSSRASRSWRWNSWADTLKYAIGVANAADLLSQWEGFGRFCRQNFAVEPLTLLRALRLGEKDPASEVLAVYSDAKVDEAKAAE